MSTEYGKRLKAARKHAKLTQEKLSEKTGIAQSTISTAERLSGGSADTTTYAIACGVDAHWLATGEGAMLGAGTVASALEGVGNKSRYGNSHATSPYTLSQRKQPVMNIENNARDNLAILPGVERIKTRDDTVTILQFDTGGSMGDGLLLRNQPGAIRSWAVSEEWLRKNIPQFTSAKNVSIVTGFGDSMKGMFNSGDPVVIDCGITSVDYDAVYFFRVGDEGFIKRLQRIPGEGLRVLSENKKYDSWTIRPDMDFEVFGRVLKAWQGEDF